MRWVLMFSYLYHAHRPFPFSIYAFEFLVYSQKPSTQNHPFHLSAIFIESYSFTFFVLFVFFPPYIILPFSCNMVINIIILQQLNGFCLPLLLKKKKRLVLFLPDPRRRYTISLFFHDLWFCFSAYLESKKLTMIVKFS